jgi:endoglucanase
LLSLLCCACGEGHGSLPFGASAAAPQPVDAGVDAPAVAPKQAIPLATDPLGWTTSSLGIQGAWSTAASLDSSIAVESDGSAVCLSGATGQALNRDYTTYWGTKATLGLCQSSATDLPPDTTYTLGTCPWAPGLAEQVVGVRLTIDVPTDGSLPRELRVVFRQQGRNPSPYVTVPGAGTVVALFADAMLPNDSTPVDPGAVDAIELYEASSRLKLWPFDFCVTSLEVLTGSGWSSLPDWTLEPGPGRQVNLAGVNLSCAEWGSGAIPGTYGTDYIYPTPAEVDYYVSAGMNVMRLPFLWERLQPALGGELDPDQLGRIRSFVDYTVGLGARVILDPHNFGVYGGGVIGVDFEVGEFADLWRRLAEIFGSNDKVIFGLMNEPYRVVPEDWLVAANAAIAAIRSTGAGNLILVPGADYTGAWSWTTINGDVMAGVVDPGDRFVFEMHQYLDGDNSGTGALCDSETIGSERLSDATDWLRQTRHRAVLAEFGAPANETCLRAMDDLMAYVGNNADVWMGWAVWAGGPWWGESLLSVEPRANGKDRTQMAVLRRYLGAP